MGILNSIQNIFSSTPKKETQRSINYNFGFGNKIAVSPSSALTFSAVWAAMRLLSESVSSLPVKVCRKEANGDIVEIENDLSYLLKYAPNTYQNKITFIEKIMMDLLCNGNSYVRIVRNNAGRPIELLPLNYAGVTVYFRDNRVYYTSDQEAGTFESDNMLHFKLITDVNAAKGNTQVDGGIVGLSPIEQNANAISWGQSVEEYAKLSGANQTAVLEEGLTYQPISISAEQAQFLASRQFSIEEIARIFNVPPHLLKDLTKSSFNNIEMQSQEFVTYSLLPYLTKIETEMNLKLFRRNQIGKEYVKFNTNALLRGNIKDRADYYKTAITNGWLTINEVRRKEEMNRIDDGDSNYLQMNMTTIDKIGEDAS